MNRIAVVVLTLAVIAGSVPAAATLADDTTQDSETEPGAAFAGVVGVQQAEVDNEVAQRSLDQRFAAAESNDSKARVVADQSEELSERLDELEAEKARLEQARENGSIGQGEYRARLAGLAAEIRAVERQANRTATVAQSLPEEALQANGANVSEVRQVAQQANRTGGGEVAEAARAIAGGSVGDGLRGPPNASERGAPDGVGSDANRSGPPEAGNSSGPGNSGPSNETTPGQNAPSGANTTDGATGTDVPSAGADGENVSDDETETASP